MNARADRARRAGRRPGADRARGGQVRDLRRAGAPVVTDGPFPESKELLAGYRIDRRRVARAGHRDRGPGVGRAGPERRAAPAADRGARGHGAAGPGRVTGRPTRIEDLLRDAAPQVLGARRPPLRQLRRRRGRRAGGAARGRHPVARRQGMPDNPRRLADPGRLAPHDRPAPQRRRRAGGARTLGRARSATRAAPDARSRSTTTRWS